MNRIGSLGAMMVALGLVASCGGEAV